MSVLGSHSPDSSTLLFCLPGRSSRFGLSPGSDLRGSFFTRSISFLNSTSDVVIVNIPTLRMSITLEWLRGWIHKNDTAIKKLKVNKTTKLVNMTIVAFTRLHKNIPHHPCAQLLSTAPDVGKHPIQASSPSIPPSLSLLFTPPLPYHPNINLTTTLALAPHPPSPF